MLDDLVEFAVVEAAGTAIEAGAKRSVIFKVFLWLVLALIIGVLIYITVKYS